MLEPGIGRDDGKSVGTGFFEDGLVKHQIGKMELRQARLLGAEKLARAAAVLAETAADARRRGLAFDYELPDPAAAGRSCRENIGRSLFIAADGAVSPCVYVNVPAAVVDPQRRIFGNVKATDPVEIWESPEFSRFRERLAGGDPDLPCRGCPKRFMA